MNTKILTKDSQKFLKDFEVDKLLARLRINDILDKSNEIKSLTEDYPKNIKAFGYINSETSWREAEDMKEAVRDYSEHKVNHKVATILLNCISSKIKRAKIKKLRRSFQF